MPHNAKAFVVDKIEYGAPAGAVMFTRMEGRKTGWVHACPCGCGMVSYMGFDPALNTTEATWQVTSGNLDDIDHLTLAPSIGIKGPNGEKYHWHGFLENGVFVER